MEFGGDVDLTALGSPDSEEVDHVMDPDDGGAGVHALTQGNQRVGQAPSRHPAGEGTDEVLAGHGEQDGPGQRSQHGQRAEDGDRLGGGLGEVGTRIEHDLLRPDPSTDGC